MRRGQGYTRGWPGWQNGDSNASHYETHTAFADPGGVRADVDDAAEAPAARAVSPGELPHEERWRASVILDCAKGLPRAAVAERNDCSVSGVDKSASPDDVASQPNDMIWVPPCPELVSPILVGIPLQLLAYHIAKCRGEHIDQPRNLAKTVTVE